MNKRHLITTDNDFMAEVGLSAFTTGDLYTWITANNGKNLGYLQLPSGLVTALEHNMNNATPEVIAQGKAAAAYPIMDIMLGVDKSWLTANQIASVDKIAGDPEAVITDFGFSRWRKEGRNSKDYAYYWVHDSEFNNWKVSFENQPGPNTVKDFDKISLALNNEDLSPTDGRYTNNSISRIIEMNELVLDDGYLDLGSTSILIAQRTARHNLIRDIKKSYEGGISWQSPSEAPPAPDPDNPPPDWRIVFNNINGDPCPQTVNFKLSLYSTGYTPTKATAVNATRFFQAPVNATNQDSRRSVTAETRAGELDISANPKSGKFEAGTKAILAVMETDLENAVAPDDGTLGNPDDWGDPEKGFQQKHGKARPLNDNGKNPYSFSPNWAHPEKTPGNPKSLDQLNTMESVHVVNRLPNSSFTEGDIVLLHKIDSIWQPMAAQAKEPEPVYVTPTVGQWDFMYLVSNADNYFKYKNADDQYATVSFADREDQFYDYYYTNGLDPAKSSLVTGVLNSYVQMTSWDFMGAAVGGLRAQHALGQTQFARNVLGGYISAPSDQRGTVTAPFFGCVFPDGYRLKDGQFDEFKMPLEYDMKVKGFIQLYSLPFERYINNIPKDTTVFAEQDNGNWRLDQVDTERVGEKSIFSHVFAGDETLHQLPADIATNASPDSTIGSPLTNFQELEWAFSHLAENVDGSVQDRVTAFLNSGLPLRHAWLEYSAGPNSGDSTFEFTPLNKRRVQFRPLKAEVYSTFEKLTASDVIGPGGRGNYADQSWQSISDGEIPVSFNVIDRCFPLGSPSDQGLDGVIGPILDADEVFKEKAFRCAVDIAENGNVKKDGDAAFPDNYWRETWNVSAVSPGRVFAGGGVGVIGASCKITANTEIIFNTVCNYGMDSQFNVANMINQDQSAAAVVGGIVDIASSFMIGEILSRGGIQHGPWAGTFGGQGHRVDSLHETALFAKIFHSWPKLQTVYDSRYFAVYHFADGIGDLIIPEKYYSVKADSTPIEITGYTDDDVQVTALEEYNNLKEDIPDSDPLEQRAVEVGYLGGLGVDPPSIKTKFVVQQLTYTTATGIYPATDFREPTLVGKDAEHYGVLASAGSIVWKDGTGLPDSPDNGWRDPDHWRVNGNCRGKLLPTQEEKMDIVLKIKSDEVGVYNEPEEAFDIVISAPGGAYEEGDTFTTKGGSGTGVVLEPILEGGNKGPLIGFTVVNRGTGFVPDDFFSKEDVDKGTDYQDNKAIGTYQSAKVKIVPIFSNNGDGLEAYVPIGIVYPSKHIIPKPLRATEEEFIQLSITPQPPQEANGTNQRAMNASRTVSAQIPVQNKSPDSAYDVFLHFHNDISHTFIETQAANPDCTEQAIEVTISPI
jgi:hypothetical protein